MNQPRVMTEGLPENWMRRLQPTHWIWLVKEQQYGTVSFPFHPAAPGHRAGELVLRKLHPGLNGYVAGTPEIWFVGENGEGLDGKQLLWPCEGYLDEEPAKVMQEAEMSIRRHINLYTQGIMARIAELEMRVSSLEFREGGFIR